MHMLADFVHTAKAEMGINIASTDTHSKIVSAFLEFFDDVEEYIHCYDYNSGTFTYIDNGFYIFSRAHLWDGNTLTLNTFDYGAARDVKYHPTPVQ